MRGQVQCAGQVVEPDPVAGRGRGEQDGLVSGLLMGCKRMHRFNSGCPAADLVTRTESAVHNPIQSDRLPFNKYCPNTSQCDPLFALLSITIEHRGVIIIIINRATKI